ncbi:MAG: ABC transporter substrate binding protein [Desulfobulbia bacterium]
MLTMAKIAGEQGEWTAKAALRIIKGARPDSIPIAANQRWNVFINPSLLKKTGFTLSPEITSKAVQVGP